MAVAEMQHSPRVRISRAILSGFIASAAMLLAFPIAYGAALLQAGVELADRPYAATLRKWFLGLTDNVLVDLARPNLYEAIGVYFASGLVWAVVYASVFEPRMGGPTWRRGLLFSLVPGLFSLLVVLPLVGGGLFGIGLGAGPLPVIGNLVLYAVYGLVLAATYGPFGDRAVDGRAGPLVGDDTWGMPHVEAGAAWGLARGLGLGGLLGLGGVLILPVTGESLPLDMHPRWFLIESTLVGGAFGLFVGSLSGLSSSEPPASDDLAPQPIRVPHRD